MYESSGFDQQTKAYLKRIINSIFVTLVWMMACAVAGLYFDFAIIKESISIANILFYLLFLLTLVFLVRYLMKLWKGFL